MRHIAAFDSVPEDMTDFYGLGFVDGILICHYTEERKALYDKLKAEGKYKVYVLKDDESLIIDM